MGLRWSLLIRIKSRSPLIFPCKKILTTLSRPYRVINLVSSLRKNLEKLIKINVQGMIKYENRIVRMMGRIVLFQNDVIQFMLLIFRVSLENTEDTLKPVGTFHGSE